MREILFKAKSKESKKWAEGYYCKVGIGNDTKPSDTIFVPWKLDRNEKWGWIKIIPETLCQYTGLKDKDGNRIWENDIVKHEIAQGIGTVKWYIGDYVGWCVDDIFDDEQQYSDDMWNECEVIGNIFDNPEILERS